MRKTLIAELVLQYIQENVKTVPTPIEVFSAARLGGNHNRVNFLTEHKDYRMNLWSGEVNHEG